ncbi:unnamed protein product [Parajaminaea phylloscopi]
MPRKKKGNAPKKKQPKRAQGAKGKAQYVFTDPYSFGTDVSLEESQGSLASWSETDAKYAFTDTRELEEQLMTEGGAWEAECLLRYRRHPRQGFQQYRTKWQGFPVHANTWEPEAHFDPDVVKDFWALQGGRPEDIPPYLSGDETPPGHDSDTDVLKWHETKEGSEARKKARIEFRRDKKLYREYVRRVRQGKIKDAARAKAALTNDSDAEEVEDSIRPHHRKRVHKRIASDESSPPSSPPPLSPPPVATRPHTGPLFAGSGSSSDDSLPATLIEAVPGTKTPSKSAAGAPDGSAKPPSSDKPANQHQATAVLSEPPQPPTTSQSAERQQTPGGLSKASQPSISADKPVANIPRRPVAATSRIATERSIKELLQSQQTSRARQIQQEAPDNLEKETAPPKTATATPHVPQTLHQNLAPDTAADMPSTGNAPQPPPSGAAQTIATTSSATTASKGLSSGDLLGSIVDRRRGQDAASTVSPAAPSKPTYLGAHKGRKQTKLLENAPPEPLPKRRGLAVVQTAVQPSAALAAHSSTGSRNHTEQTSSQALSSTRASPWTPTSAPTQPSRPKARPLRPLSSPTDSSGSFPSPMVPPPPSISSTMPRTGSSSLPNASITAQAENASIAEDTGPDMDHMWNTSGSTRLDVSNSELCGPPEDVEMADGEPGSNDSLPPPPPSGSPPTIPTPPSSLASASATPASARVEHEQTAYPSTVFYVDADSDMPPWKIDPRTGRVRPLRLLALSLPDTPAPWRAAVQAFAQMNAEDRRAQQHQQQHQQ